MRKDLAFEFCNTVSDRNPMIAAPLRKTDCLLVSDGAAAVILAADDAVADFPRAVRLRARVQVNDYLPMARRRVVDFEGPRRAWQQALQQAGCAVHDLSLAEVHDCFTIAELLAYEAMGLAPTGQGHRLLEDGTVLRRPLARQRVGRAQGQGLPDWRHGRVNACGVGHAAHRRSGRPAGARRHAGGRVQHGRIGRGQLREHSGARPMNIAHLLRRSALLHAHRPALLHGDQVLWSYGTLGCPHRCAGRPSAHVLRRGPWRPRGHLRRQCARIPGGPPRHLVGAAGCRVGAGQLQVACQRTRLRAGRLRRARGADLLKRWHPPCAMPGRRRTRCWPWLRRIPRRSHPHAHGCVRPRAA